MARLIGYARVSTRQQGADQQEVDLRAVGVASENLHVDRLESGGHASLPALDAALQAVEGGDTLVVPTLDRLGRSTVDLMTLAAALRAEGVALRVLDLDGLDRAISDFIGTYNARAHSELGISPRDAWVAVGWRDR